MMEKTVLQVTILLDESHIEELRGWRTVNNGEIVKIEKPRKKTLSAPGKIPHQMFYTCIIQVFVLPRIVRHIGFGKNSK